MDSYQLLKKELRLDVACRWLQEDSQDDFFVDPFKFSDISQSGKEYLLQRQHRIFQVDSVSHGKEFVPKRNGMLREAVWLHPIHRVIYLSILHYFLPRLDALLNSGVYSYRRDSDDDPDAYPFSDRMDRWKNFHNDFREAALDPSAKAVLVTDVASFFDHISCDALCLRIRNLLGQNFTGRDEAILDLLCRLLKMWSTNGYGIPQNFDASSFLGSLYLNPVDHEMVGKRYRYFRWLDDIRIVATSKVQALRALHDLQRSLAAHRLFLASDKTHIYVRGDGHYEDLLNVEDDVVLGSAEEMIRGGSYSDLRGLISILTERLNFHHSAPNGDDRKFRAFANRLLDVGDFKEISGDVHPIIETLVLPRLKTHPDRSDYWVKMLSVRPTEATKKAVEELLISEPSIYDWQRYHLWRLVVHFDSITPALLSKAVETGGTSTSDLEAAQAIICAGKHGDNTVREQLFGRYFSTQRSYPVQRSVLIAIQELPTKTRSALFERALEIRSEHRELITYLQSREKPTYGQVIRPERKCLPEPLKVESTLTRGIGLSGGKTVRFRLSRSDFNYE